jgi:cation diffusion facilitator family transporter
MADSCAAARFEGASPAYKRALWSVVAINAAMFVTEVAAGQLAGSLALQADALDFAGDAATYGLTLAVIGRSEMVRSTAALIKGGSLALFALFILATAALRVSDGAPPDAPLMSGVGVLALAANVASVLILIRWRSGDANVRSVWLCSRNDAIGNVAVIAAGGAVWATGNAWPDLLVAAVLSVLFLSSSYSIIRQAAQELRGTDVLPRIGRRDAAKDDCCAEPSGAQPSAPEKPG